jgi:hypothetical protein
MPGRSFRRHREQHTIAWGRSNLRAETPEALTTAGVTVHYSPNVPSEVRVIDLDDGRIDTSHDGQERPEHGWFADYESVARYCEAHGLPLEEVNGFAIMQAHGSGEAGDPLAHERRPPRS